MASWKPISIHLAWALAVAGAWWLGGRREIESSSGRAGIAGRFTESRLSGPAVEGHHSVIAPRAAAAVTETGDWLRQWSGPGGLVSPEQMAAAVQAALSDSDSVRGLRHFTCLLAALTPENASVVEQVLRGHPLPDAASWMTMLASAWGSVDGQGALTAFSKDGYNAAAMDAAMTAWAAATPAAARFWLETRDDVFPSGGSIAGNNIPDISTMKPGPELEALRASLVRGLARNDMSAALAYVTALSDNRADYVRVLAGEQFRNGAPAAAKWAAELPDESMRGAALEAVARRYMQVDASAGAAWGAEIADEQDTRAAVGRVADRMAEKDVRAAFDWTLKLPPGPGQEEAFQQVFSEWARQDPGASSQELQSMTPGPERDNAIHSFSRILVNENPEDAIIWATAISDPALRLDTQLDVVRQWNTTSPDAARTWVAANLPADARAKALAPPDD